MTLRTVAVAAPDRISGKSKSENAIDSVDPASLFNACRVAGQRAVDGVGGWGDSNWATSPSARRDCIMLMSCWEEDETAFRALLDRERPNLLLIGAMSLCLPGAVECAHLARQMLGDRVCIVLGGRHANETVFREGGGRAVHHHAASPLRLMREGHIPAVFDIVASGECEELIAELGECVARTVSAGRPASAAAGLLEQLEDADGNWIVGQADGDLVETKIAAGRTIDYNMMPTPAGIFGVRAAFGIYPGRKTAHVFSDVGRGCAYDCTFCSEARSIVGAPVQVDSSAQRLHRQLKQAAESIAKHTPDFGASAFVEDSLLLAGKPAALNQLAAQLSDNPVPIAFGAQLTIDQILQRKEQLIALHECGLDYLFIGLETLDPKEVGGFSKDIGRRGSSWVDRADDALNFLAETGIRCGAAVLFGLGEHHRSRIALLEQIAQWRARYGMPAPISMNWATQHPLMGRDGGANYTYEKWGVPKGPFLDAFRHFGEGSLVYPVMGVQSPTLGELHDVIALRTEMDDQRGSVVPVQKPESVCL